MLWFQPLAASSHHHVSRGVTVNVTWVDLPAPRLTRWKPTSWRGGSPAADGSLRYSCATSEPARWPTLVTVALTCMSRTPLPGAPFTRRLLNANFV